MARAAIIIKPSTLLHFHNALKKRKYRLLYSPRGGKKLGRISAASSYGEGLVSTSARHLLTLALIPTSPMSSRIGQTVESRRAGFPYVHTPGIFTWLDSKTVEGGRYYEGIGQYLTSAQRAGFSRLIVIQGICAAITIFDFKEQFPNRRGLDQAEEVKYLSELR